MSRTPTRHNVSLDSLNLSFKSPKSPAQDACPLTKRLLVILQHLSNSYASWNKAHKRGISVCRSIETIKCKSLEKDSHFPDDLKLSCEELESLLTTLNDALIKTRDVKKQISALAKLDANSQIVLKSWTMKKIEKFVEDVLKAFEEEFRIKKLVKENIAFSLSHAESIHMSCVWEYQYFVNQEISTGFTILSAELR
ncbi:uncharacterized protein LOC132259382 isoform X1 [Phlebotomus argentipes]|uniref:uncharacterized protein LOC132259382 isoform X1 n=1 Tax=Phlebotomus argentipes TaxID=94469 RepID=UPI0028929A84|nr:uncharacterized protein LOC132259382 isoform X1 [Phlebotomus argentipes]XP_059612981.1 uncharacterized protein LOC132259382 isoform X1 [Phlebotomus argentipes]